MSRGPRSLRTHLAAAIGLIVLVSVGLTLAVGSVLTRREVEHATLAGVSRQADLLAQSERASLTSRVPELRPILARQHERVIFPFPALDRASPLLPEWARERLLAHRPADGKVNGDFFAARNVNGRAFVLLRANRVASASRPFLEGLLLSALAGAALAALVAALLAGRITRPLRRVAGAIPGVAAGRRHEPVPPGGARELASLAAAFNAMAARLERARAAERDFLLSVSHELKTPLTAIRGYAEGLADEAVTAQEAAETITAESERLERLVGDLLDLARMNRSEFSVRREPIDLGVAAHEAVRRHEGQARAFGVRLEAEVANPAPAVGDAGRLLQVASNLVENALRLTPAGGLVRVVAAPGLLAVEDTGPGLAPEELDRAFERFFLYSRYGAERAVGTGLGLAIVEQLARGMGGTVAVTSEPGLVTRFTVTLELPEPSTDVLRPAYADRTAV